MIVAIASLITALFLGGPTEIFYVDNLEKGIKKQVLEKERKKEIFSEIKSTKTLYKSFEKERKKDYKSFLNLYMDKNTTPDGLNSFFKELKEKRAEYQNKLIDQRLVIYEKIQSEEWDNILKSSVSVSEKNLAKAEKKGAKAKEDFRKTRRKIEDVITNEAKRNALLNGLEVVINSGNELGKKTASLNSTQNQILANKNSAKSDLQKIIIEDSEQRTALLESLTSFHELARENCSDAEWYQIMESFTKEMQMSTR